MPGYYPRGRRVVGAGRPDPHAENHDSDTHRIEYSRVQARGRRWRRAYSNATFLKGQVTCCLARSILTPAFTYVVLSAFLPDVRMTFEPTKIAKHSRRFRTTNKD
jgi:hypothetical protein